MQTTSKDGTVIAYERSGAGAPIILVDGALCSREFGPMAKLAPLLAAHFTVYVYDRRGRGQSGDTPPLGQEREVEDIAALIEAAGQPVFLLGLSSGAALALQAAASGLAIRKVVAYEPPYVGDSDKARGADHQRTLEALLATGDRAGAVKYFMRSMVGVPAPFVLLMQLIPGIWRKMKAVAHTLPYDAVAMTEFKIPTERLASIRVPVLVMHGSKTDAKLQVAARAVADATPGARHQILARQTHNVQPEVIAPAVIEFCVGETETAAANVATRGAARGS